MGKELRRLLTHEASATDVAKAVQKGLNSWNYVGASHCALRPGSY